MGVSGQAVPVDRDAIIQLRRDLIAAGAFEPARAATILKLIAHVVLAGLLLAACYYSPLWLAVILCPFCALSWVIAVMIGHDATHRATFKSRLGNATLRCITFPLLSGMSGLFWQYKHNVLHHTYPNVDGLDDDYWTRGPSWLKLALSLAPATCTVRLAFLAADHNASVGFADAKPSVPEFAGPQ